MSIHDVSLEIKEDMITWDDEEESKPEIHEGERSESSGSLNSRICLGSHTGTHIDAPKHFLSDGYPIDKVPLRKLMGKCKVVDCTEREEKVKPEDVKDFDEDILLFKTKNSKSLEKQKFNREYIYVSEEACEKITEYGYETVGIDYLGIGEYGNTRPAHEALLDNDVIVIEGLDLRGINDGRYRFVGLPLKIKDADGAPARATLEEIE